MYTNNFMTKFIVSHVILLDNTPFLRKFVTVWTGKVLSYPTRALQLIANVSPRVGNALRWITGITITAILSPTLPSVSAN